MTEFLRLSSPQLALTTLLEALPIPVPSSEIVDTSASLNRVLAEDVIAPHPLPEFTRSTVDGYAVRASDTYGVTESQPGYLSMAGEALMGKASTLTLNPGNCVLIHTGGMLPEHADAVIMIENTQRIGLTIEITRAVGVWENVIQIGEDIQAGETVIRSGSTIHPAMIGGCMALGKTKLRVAKKIKIGILSSGDEVIHPEEEPLPGQVRDINSYSLAALVEQAGGQPVLLGVVPDDLSRMVREAGQGLQECDLLLITAGSSASVRDITARAVQSLGKPGLLVHGINIRPGKPTILAVCNGKAVVGLPGNPVSAVVVAGLIVQPVVRYLMGAHTQEFAPTVRAKAAVNIPSQTGREDWVAVRLVPVPSFGEEPRYQAEPIFGKSNLIFTLVAADGMIHIPSEVTGIHAGEIVEVSLSPGQ